MATIDYKQLSTPEANLIELLSAQNQDGTYSAKLMGSEPFSVLAAKTIYNTYNDIESNMAADVEGPASSTDNALARFDGTTGKLIQNSNAILTDAGALSLASNLTVSGTGTSTFSGAIKARSGYSDEVGVGPYGTGTGGIYFGNGTVALYNDANTQLKSLVGLSLGGNLTVSGGTITGGTSGLSLASGGTNKSITLTPSGTGIVSINRGLAASATGTAFVVQTTDASSLSLFAELEGNATSASRYVTLNSYMGGGGGGRNLVINRYGGNLLIGTTINSNALLQVGTNTTTATGGMVFGTDTFLFRRTSYSLQLEGAGSNTSIILSQNGVLKAGFTSFGTTLFVDTIAAGDQIVFRSGAQVPALTLDSAQRAQFEGKVTINGANSVLVVKGANPTSSASSTIVDWASNARIISYGSTVGTAAGFNFVGLSSDGSVGGTRFTIDSAGDATFAGKMGIGGASVAASSLILRGLSLTTGATQIGVDQQTTFNSDATTSGRGITSVVVTKAASFTMANGVAFYAVTPVLGAGSAITTNTGLYVANQGATGITNAYGIDIAAQSGAATTNIGLRNLGATVLLTPAAAVTLTDNSTMTFELTSNTSLTIKVRGTDGTTRSVALTLA